MKLLDRIRAITLTPRTEWPVVAREPGGVALFTHYVAILAVIPAVAHFIGAVAVGRYMPILPGLGVALLDYGLGVLEVLIVALIIEALARTFSGHRDFANALKLSVYSHTPAWLAGLFLIVPGLSFLAVVGLYAIYLLGTGLPTLMKVPPGKVVSYAAAVAGWAVVLLLAFGWLEAGLFAPS